MIIDNEIIRIYGRTEQILLDLENVKNKLINNISNINSNIKISGVYTLSDNSKLLQENVSSGVSNAVNDIRHLNQFLDKQIKAYEFTVSDAEQKLKSFTTSIGTTLALSVSGSSTATAMSGSTGSTSTASTTFDYSVKTVPFSSAGLSAEDYNKILKGTVLEGKGQEIINMENEYGVNGMFCLGVARLESGLGTSGLAKSNNNLFGIRSGSGWAKYSSPVDSVMGFAKLMSKENGYYKNKSIEQIAPIYCNNIWGGKVVDCIRTNYNKLKS